MNFTLLDDTDVSQAYAAYLRELRQRAKLSRTRLRSVAAYRPQPLRSLS